MPNTLNDGTLEYIGNVIVVDNRNERREILKRTNLLGQEVSQDYKGIVILMYNDGTSQKVLML